MIDELAAEGIGIILISSDLPEVLAMSDRVLVMREGRQMAIFDRDEATQETVMTAAMGQAQRCRRSARHELAAAPRPPRADPRAQPAPADHRRGARSSARMIDDYFTSRTFNRIASSVAIIAVVAVGQTLVVLTRNIDLSVGSIVGFTAYFVGTLLAANNGMPPLVAVLIAVGARRRLGADQRRARRLGPGARRSSSRSARWRSTAASWSTIPAPRRSPPTACRTGWSTCRASTCSPSATSRSALMVALALVDRRRLPAGAPATCPSAAASTPSAPTPTRRAADRPADAAHRLHRLRAVRRAGRPGRLHVPGPLRQHHRRRRRRAGAAGRSPPSWSAASTSSAARARSIGALLGAVMIGTLEQSLFRWLQISEFWRDALLGLLILLAVASDAVILQSPARAVGAQRTCKLDRQAGRRRVPSARRPAMTA